jgi:hypothetical protein
MTERYYLLREHYSRDGYKRKMQILFIKRVEGFDAGSTIYLTTK